jgi:hypothetical protein
MKGYVSALAPSLGPNIEMKNLSTTSGNLSKVQSDHKNPIGRHLTCNSAIPMLYKSLAARRHALEPQAGILKVFNMSPKTSAD